MPTLPPRLVLLLLVLLPLTALPPAVRAQAPATGAARVIVKFKSDSALMQMRPASVSAMHAMRAQALGDRIGRTLTAGAGLADRTQVVVGADVTPEELAHRLAAEPDVEYAVPDGIKHVRDVPNDPLYLSGGASGPAVGQWYLRAPSGSLKSAIDAESAWAVTTGSSAIVVADVDTGVRFDHPELAPVSAGGNLLPGYDMVSDPAYGNDGDGRDPDPSDPGDWVTTTEVNSRSSPFYHCTEPDPSTGRYVGEDSVWHGTQVAGLIAALTNNGVGMASVGRNVRLLPVRSLGKCGSGFDSDIIAGMRWAAGLSVPGVPANPYPARVINLSLGSDGEPCNAAYLDAVAQLTSLGVVVVAAAGNSNGHAVGVPANCSGVIAVAGLRHVGTKVGYSSLGPEVAISAPAGNCVNSYPAPCQYPILTTTNTGTTVPQASTYTDSDNASFGTSFATPLVSGAAALMLSAQPSLTPGQVRSLLQATARTFPTSSADATAGNAVPQCTAPRVDASGNPVDQDECICTTLTCGAGMLDAGAAVRAAAGGTPSAFNAQGLWWAAPAGSESGWGVNFAHQGDTIFATWYTYGINGGATWLTMTAIRVGGVYSGTIYQSRGPAFSSVPFDPTRVVTTAVGTGTLTFTDADNATFAYAVSGVSQTKRITRQAFGTIPVCTFGAQSNLALATNYQDLWWNAPANSEAGWGLSIAEESGVIFAVWYTYDVDGSPLWLSATMTSSGPGFAGTLYRTTGPAFSATSFDPAAVGRAAVGTATLTFADGNNGTFSYTLGNVSQSKPITRQVFRAPGTVCQ